MTAIRNELPYTDNQLIDLLYKGYQIKAKKLTFVDTGSFYAFVVTTNENKRLFLKIYPKNQSLVPIHPTVEYLNYSGMALDSFRNKFGISNVSFMIKDCSGYYCHSTHDLILAVFDYIEGFHPKYEPNQLDENKLAKLFFQLHQIPCTEFTYFPKEEFDIHYALGLRQWVSHEIEIVDGAHADSMLALLDKHTEQLKTKLNQLQQEQKKWAQEQIPMVITHGDPHHYNVLQTPFELWLVDWDGLKIAPVERDLWHYQNAPLLDAYCKLNPNFVLNHELCEWYRLQRFFEDCCYCFEQVLLGKNKTQEQSESDKNWFLSHWGWDICLY